MNDVLLMKQNSIQKSTTSLQVVKWTLNQESLNSRMEMAHSLCALTNNEKAEVFNNFFTSVFTVDHSTNQPDFQIQGSIELLQKIPLCEESIKTRLKNLNPYIPTGHLESSPSDTGNRRQSLTCTQPGFSVLRLKDAHLWKNQRSELFCRYWWS